MHECMNEWIEKLKDETVSRWMGAEQDNEWMNENNKCWHEELIKIRKCMKLEQNEWVRNVKSEQTSLK